MVRNEAHIGKLFFHFLHGPYIAEGTGSIGCSQGDGIRFISFISGCFGYSKDLFFQILEFAVAYVGYICSEHHIEKMVPFRDFRRITIEDKMAFHSQFCCHCCRSTGMVRLDTSACYQEIASLFSCSIGAIFEFTYLVT